MWVNYKPFTLSDLKKNFILLCQLACRPKFAEDFDAKKAWFDLKMGLLSIQSVKIIF